MIDLAAVWGRMRDAIDCGAVAVERLLRGAGLPAHEARLVAAASAFRARVAGRRGRGPRVRRSGSGGRARPRAVVLPGRGAARAVPGGRVQLRPADGPRSRAGDGHALPALRLVLLRTIAVLALALPAVLLLGLVVPGEAPFAWLLPAVGFVAVVLAASTWVSPLNAAVAVSAAWLMTVWLLATRLASPAAVLQARVQVAFLALAAASFGIFLVRRRHLRQLRPWR